MNQRAAMLALGMCFLFGHPAGAADLDQCVSDCMNYNTIKQKRCNGQKAGEQDDPNLPIPTPRACILNYPEICRVKCQNNIPF